MQERKVIRGRESLKKLPEMLAYYESKGCEVKTHVEYQ